MPLMEDTLLKAHFGGATLTEIAEAEGVRSPETARKRLAEAKREHVIRVAGELLLARRSGEVLWFVLPAMSGDEGLQAGLRYFAWVVSELEDLAVRCWVRVKDLPDGSFALGIEEDAQGGDQA